ncbi:restriction endonuclease subunit S [Nostoc sp.]|uniref:restriction endonuclease subunit S n=1 Tax=Nostoc sp. TaxID=1180 RepID=UPI002FF9A509
MSKKIKKKVPKLRFSEFSEDLEFKYLGEILDFKNGINADKSQYGQGIKFINVLDIINQDPIYYDSIIGCVDINDQEFQKNNVQYGDVLFQRSSEIREEAGQSNIYLDKNRDATFGGFVIRGRPKTKFNPIYFNYLLKTSFVRKEITDRSGGSTRFNVGQDSLSQIPILICNSLAEQEKIASFFGAVDRRLTQLRRKQELLQTYKRGVMQKIFSQQIRFKQDDGTFFPDWQKKKLGELGTFLGGGTPSTSQKNYWTGGKIPWISSSDLEEDSIYKISITRFINETAIKESATKRVPPNSILIISRVGVGKIAVSKQEVCTSQDFSNFTPNQGNVYFLAYLLISQKNKLLSISQGTSIKGFTNYDLSLLKIDFPCIEEQEKIVIFFNSN